MNISIAEEIPGLQLCIDFERAENRYKKYCESMAKKIATTENPSYEEMVEIFELCHKINNTKNREQFVKMVNSLEF